MNDNVDDLQKAMADLVNQQTQSKSGANQAIDTPPPVVESQPASAPAPSSPPPPPPSPKPTQQQPATKSVPAPVEKPAPSPQPNSTDHDIDSVKKEAIGLLKPMISTLDIPPEEKFEAIIEIIRASDDESMIKPALEAAKGINGKDAQAQAFIDIINEINYINKQKSLT